MISYRNWKPTWIYWSCLLFNPSDKYHSKEKKRLWFLKLFTSLAGKRGVIYKAIFTTPSSKYLNTRTNHAYMVLIVLTIYHTNSACKYQVPIKLSIYNVLPYRYIYGLSDISLRSWDHVFVYVVKTSAASNFVNQQKYT